MVEQLSKMKISEGEICSMDMVKDLPEEIIEVILEQLKDSEDLTNFCIVYPQLKSVFYGHLWSWLIAAAMPLLFPKYLNRRDMINCRLVSKRWKNAICQTLQTHPDRLPYKSCRLSRITETHFNYHRVTGNPVNLGKMCNSEWWQTNTGRLSINENPFLGRHVYINVKTDNTVDNELRKFRGNVYVGPHAKIDLYDAMPILQKYGHHIYSLTIKISSLLSLNADQIIYNVISPLFQCLEYLPNLIRLRFLKCSLCVSNITSERLQEIQKIFATTSLPFRLESLNLFQAEYGSEFHVKIFYCFMKAFVNHDKIEKLVMYNHNWTSGYGHMFPNLRELHLKMTGWVYPHPDAISLQKIMHELRNSPIRKVQLDAKDVYIGDILGTLAIYKIESLVLLGDIKEHRKVEIVRNKSTVTKVGRSIRAAVALKRATIHSTNDFTDEVGTPCVLLPSILSLRLSLRRNSVWFEFLNLLPSLEYITVEIVASGWSPTHAGEWQRYIRSTNGFYSCLKRFYADDNYNPENWKLVWDEFPNLKMLIIIKSGRTYQYARECKNNVFIS